MKKIFYAIIFIASIITILISMVDLFSIQSVWDTQHMKKMTDIDMALLISGFFSGFYAVKFLTDEVLNSSDEPLVPEKNIEAQLKEELQIAVDNEDFEEALKIKNKLDRITNQNINKNE